MSRTGICILLAAGLLLVATPQAHAWWTYVSDFEGKGVYDEQAAQMNTVDREATGNTKTLAQFASDVATAFAADAGGICTFDVVQGYEDGAGTKRAGLSASGNGRGRNIFAPDSDYPNGDRPTLWYGANQTFGVQLLPARCLEIWDNVAGLGDYSSIGMPISGPAYGTGETVWNNGAVCTPETNWVAGDNTKETLSFVPLQAGHAVWQLGVTLCSQITAQDVDVWVTYADNSISEVRTINLAGGSGTDDVFVHFAAGTSPIVKFDWDSNIGRPAIDDLAVIMAGGAPPQTWHPGDANKDGTVDLQDFGSLKDSFGVTESATWEMGDFTGDGAVDLQDFGVLKDHFGHTTGDSPLTAVPEPATIGAMLLGLAAVARRRRNG